MGGTQNTANKSERPSIVSSESPQPVHVDPSTGPFEKLKAGEGALITTRANHAEGAEAALGKHGGKGASKRLSGAHKPQVEANRPKIKTDKRIIAGLTVAALAVIAALGFVFWRAMGSTGAATPETSIVEQAAIDPSESFNYGGYDYALTQVNGAKHALTRTASGASEPLVLMELEGTPVAMILYKGAFLIPENLENSWDVMAYTLGDGSMPSRLVDSTGSDFVGTGMLVSAELEGNRLVLVDDQSRTVTTPLD